MKKILILVFFAGIALTSVYGQEGRMNNERIKAFRTAHFTEVMGLSSQDAEVFWPWFYEREKELKTVRKTKREVGSKLKQSLNEDNEKVISDYVDQLAKMNFREAQIKNDYHSRLKKLLPIRKVARFYQAESSWEKKLLNWIQKRRNN
ncbi:MAG: hypothetical protein AAFY71_00475 [Bacteroidota bacterium]